MTDKTTPEKAEADMTPREAATPEAAPAAATTPAEELKTPARPQRRPAEVGPESKVCLYVSNISWKINSDDLRKLMEEHGAVSKCEVVKYYDGREDRRKSKGIAFVTFEKEEDAAAAVEKLQGFELDSRELKLVFSTSTGKKNSRRRPRRAKAKRSDRTAGEEKEELEPMPENFKEVFVRGFPEETTKEELTTAFKEFGEVATVDLRNKEWFARKKPPNSRRRRPIFAFVMFNEESGAKAAADAGAVTIGEAKCEISQSERESRPRKRTEKKPAMKSDDTPKKVSGRATRPRRKLYISNLPEETDEQALRAVFEPHGELTGVKLREGADGKIRGHAFVTFKEGDDCTKYMAEAPHDDCKIGDNVLNVEYSQGSAARRKRKSARTKQGGSDMAENADAKPEADAEPEADAKPEAEAQVDETEAAPAPKMAESATGTPA